MGIRFLFMVITCGFVGLLHAQENTRVIPLGEIFESLETKPFDPPFVIAMGANWCAGCEKNQPVLQSLSQKAPVIYIHYDQEKSESGKKNQKFWYDLPDPKGVLIKKMAVGALPTTWVFYDQDRIESYVGLLPLDLESKIENR